MRDSRQQRLRVGMKGIGQKSGRLTDHSLDLLARCGLKYSRGKDQLMCYGENMPLDVLFDRTDPNLVIFELDLYWVTKGGAEEVWKSKKALSAHFGQGFTIEHEFDRTRVDDYAFGITRAGAALQPHESTDASRGTAPAIPRDRCLASLGLRSLDSRSPRARTVPPPRPPGATTGTYRVNLHAVRPGRCVSGCRC